MTRLSQFSSKLPLIFLLLGAALCGSLASPAPARAQSAPPVPPPPSRPFGAKPLPWKLGDALPVVVPSSKIVPPPALPNNWSTPPLPGFRATTMFLLTDGRVLVQEYGTTNWYTLTPDNTGSYVTGTWNPLASAPQQCFNTLSQAVETWAPIYFASAVLPDGRVVMIGGEYNTAVSNGEVWTNIGQIYDPVADTWTCLSAPSAWDRVGDSSSAVLPNGTFLLANGVGYADATLDLSGNTPTWTAFTPSGSKQVNDSNGYNNEEGWTLLPNGNVLTTEVWASNDTTVTPADEFSISTKTWSSAGTAPVPLVLISSGGTQYFEVGPSVLRPDGTVFATGATGQTAIFNPTTTTWTAGPALPTLTESFSCNFVSYTNVTEQFALADAPAALLPDGNVLISASPVDPNCGWISGTEFFEFNGSTLTQVAGSAFASTDASYYGKMLTLPTGQILFTDGGGEPQIYTETGSPNSAWAPTITTSPASAGVGAKNLVITGTQFNGLSQAVAYGDDYQAATNYPLVRITNLATSHVFYARTHGHSNMGVATGSASVSTLFDLPANIELGASTLVVVANGIASTSVPINILTPGNTALVSSQNPSNSGQSVTFTATVSGTGGTPTGTVTFYDGATSLATNLNTATLNGSGVATFTTFSLTLGTHTITAQYNGNSTFGPTTSAAVLQVVNGKPTTTSLVSSLNPSTTAQSFQLTATVTPTAGGGTPTGTVKFLDANSSLDGNTVLGTVTLSGGVAAPLTVGPLLAGTHSITAQYSGDTIFSATTSNAVSQQVNYPVPSLTSLGTTSVTAGSAGFNLIVSGSNFANGAVVNFNGSSRSTQFQGSVQLTAAILTSDLATGGSFPVTVTNPTPGGGTSGSLTFTVNNPLPTIGSISPNTGTAGGPAFTLTVNGSGYVSTSTVNFNGTAEPTSLVNSAQVTASIPMSAIATAGTFPVTVTNPSPAGGTSNTVNYTSTGGPLAVTLATLPTGVTSVVYPSTTLAATGGTAPYTWTTAPVSGSLPPGLSFSAAGVITGTPTTPGTYPFTMKVTDSASNTATGAFSITINSPLKVTLATLPAGVVNVAYTTTTVNATGGVPPYTWTTAPVSGSLPPGLLFSAAGSLSGTPTLVGTYNFTLKVTDSASTTATGAFSVTVNAALSVTLATLPTGFATSAYPSTTLNATGGISPYTWTTTPVSGSFPPGLTLSALGVLSGTPTTAGTYPFTVKVTDSNSDTATGAFSITIDTALKVTLTTLPTGVATVAYPSTTLAATGGMSPYTWTTTPVSGSLPPGMSFSATGVLSGTPTTAGTYPFTIKVTDAASNTATGAFSITVNAALNVTAITLPTGVVGAAYTATTLAATGGIPSYSWTTAPVSGSFPPGLSLSAAGVLSGTPTTAGTYPFTVKVTDSASNTATGAFSITVDAALTVTPAALPTGFATVAYPSTTLAASGGIPGYTWTTTPVSGSFPPGLSLSAAGVLSGTPTTAGTYPFTVKVTDSASDTATGAFSITVDAALKVTLATLPTGVATVAYPSTTFAATGGMTPYTWTTTPVSGSFPPGLNFSAGGVLSGTPTAAGTYPFTVKVTDAASNTATGAFSITVNAALKVTLASLPTGVVSAAYTSTSLAATGGISSYTWTTTPVSGSFPPGISLSAAGVLSGTPTTAGTYPFTVKVTDTASNTATGAFSITINAGLSVTTSSLPAGTANVAYTTTLSVAGGVSPYTWTTTPVSGSFPPGLTLSSAGVLSGTPTAAGTYPFTVKVTDSASLTATGALSVTINGPLSVTLATLPTGVATVAYPSTTFGAVGGASPYTWTTTPVSGSFPPGLSLSSTGVLSGTPTTAGTYPFTVKVTDSASMTATGAFSITVNAALKVTLATLPTGVATVAYTSTTVAASGGIPGYTWTTTPVSGSLPAGLTLSAAGLLSGTPTAAGTFPFTLKVTDSASNTATGAFSITVDASLSVTLATLPAGVVSVAYPSTTFAATGGIPGYTWTTTPVSGALPPGLSLSAAGVLSGTPTTAGTYPFTLKVTDSASDTATGAFSITIDGPLVITTTQLPVGAVGSAYPSGTALAATGGVTPYASWTVTSGSLPAGLTLASATGVISGTPTTAGTSSFTVKVTDAQANTKTANLSITVNAKLQITTALPLPVGEVGAVYSGVTLAAAGGVPPYTTWSITSGSLPGGLNLNAGTGAIAGTPTASGPFSFTMQVKDTQGYTATANFTMTVNAALAVATTSVPTGAINVVYPTTNLTASGGVSPYTWTKTAGNLPAGLSLSAAGAINGTPTVAGSSSFTVKVTDSFGVTSTANLSITINASLAISTTGALPSVDAGVIYSAPLTATGGAPPYNWTLVTGSNLPPGLSLAPSTGIISGTPTAMAVQGSSWTFTVKVTDANSQFATSNLSIAIEGVAFPTTTPITVAQGSSTTGMVTLNAVNGFNGTATLTTMFTQTPSGAVDLPVVTFTPSNTLNFSSATSQTATINIQTTAKTSGLFRPPANHPIDGGNWTWAAVAVSLAGFFFLLLGVPAQKRWGFAPLAVLVFVIVAGGVGCTTAGKVNMGNPGTTPGAYKITVTATPAPGGGQAAETTTITLTVM